jgi:hypothetical protein
VFPMINLPKAASIKQVLAGVFPMTGMDKGQVTTYEIANGVTSCQILKTRQVYTGPVSGNVPPESYTAVLVQTNLGEKIVLLKYEGDSLDWWSRVYDTNA